MRKAKDWGIKFDKVVDNTFGFVLGLELCRRGWTVCDTFRSLSEGGLRDRLARVDHSTESPKGYTLTVFFFNLIHKT